LLGFLVVYQTLKGRIGVLYGHQDNPKREATFERTHGTIKGSKASKGKPHEWHRDEISSAGRGGSKASRGCETLRAKQNRMGWVPPDRGSPRLGKH
jgi:hypothetical protein